MIKEELIAMLNELPDGTEIMLRQPTGNYWRMVAADPISPHNCTLVAVKHSDYLSRDQVADEEEWYEGDELPEGARQVFLLRD